MYMRMVAKTLKVKLNDIKVPDKTYSFVMYIILFYEVWVVNL